MASYQAEEATDVTGPTYEASQQSAAANPVGVLQANCTFNASDSFNTYILTSR